VGEGGMTMPPMGTRIRSRKVHSQRPPTPTLTSHAVDEILRRRLLQTPSSSSASSSQISTGPAASPGTLDKARDRDRNSWRYFTITHPQTGGLSDEEHCQFLIRALSKLVNSLRGGLERSMFRGRSMRRIRFSASSLSISNGTRSLGHAR